MVVVNQFMILKTQKLFQLVIHMYFVGKFQMKIPGKINYL